MKQKKKVKEKRNFASWLGIILNGFLAIFFMLYVIKFSLTDFILHGDNTWRQIFNIGVWYVIVLFLIDKFFEALNYRK